MARWFNGKETLFALGFSYTMNRQTVLYCYTAHMASSGILIKRVYTTGGPKLISG